MITTEQIDLWRELGAESQVLEFKEAKAQFDSAKLCKYCVAIANEGGGHLVLGIADRAPRKVVGTSAFRNPAEAAESVRRRVGFRVDLHEVAHPEGRVLVFKIPSRPRGTAYAFEGAYLMRAGASLVPMSEDRLRDIFAEGAPDWLEEPALTGLSEQDVVELLDTQTFFELLGMPYPCDRAGVLDRLRAEHLIARQGAGHTIFRMGGLLLARRLSDFGELQRKAVRIIEYDGAGKLRTRSDRVSDKGLATGFSLLIQLVMGRLPAAEAFVGGVRREMRLIPEPCVRELVANALVHQDLRISGTSPAVEIYENRVEISSPGDPVVTVGRFIDGYQSRNERLADLMRRMGICEEKGSGIDKVVHAAEMHRLPPPDFSNPHRRTLAVIHAPKPFEAIDRAERVRACYQHACLKHVMREYMTNQSLRERFGLPEHKAATTSQIIAAAIDEGWIKQDEAVGKSRKYARYLPYWA